MKSNSPKDETQSYDSTLKEKTLKNDSNFQEINSEEEKKTQLLEIVDFAFYKSLYLIPPEMIYHKVLNFPGSMY